MPLYEYKCSKCGACFEIIQKVNDPPIKTCIKCGGPATKAISAPAIQFKGSGFYITDYAKKPPAEKEQKTPVTETKESKKTEPASPQKSEKQPSPHTK
jgi:putative FmdB family regulatory protein